MTIAIDDLQFITKKCNHIFDYLYGKHVFVTGGTGFFGKWLLETFSYLNENHALDLSVTVLTRNKNKFEAEFPRLFVRKNIRFIQGDIRKLPVINGNFDLIIHAATDVPTTLSKESPELMRQTIMDGAKEIVMFAIRVGAKRLLYTSSGAAYGPQPANISRLSESFTNNPCFDFKNAYASEKVESERLFLAQNDFEAVIARCFTFAGPYLPLGEGYAFGDFIGNILNDECITIQGNGLSERSYMYAADLMIWLFHLLVRGEDKQIYNVGSSKSITIKDLAHLMVSTLGSRVDVNIQGNDSDGFTRYIPDVSKARELLGLSCFTSISESIVKTYAFYNN